MTDKMTKPGQPAGFQDVFNADVIARQRMIESICNVYARFGFEPLETPCIEFLEVLGKYLPESDLPTGGVFALKDEDKEWISLRYDLTAPLSRVVAQYGDDLPKPYRRYQYGPVFRMEKPGPGRFRQFYQCDFDTVGSSSAASDAEVCAVLCAAFDELGIGAGNYQVRVSNRKILNGVLESAGIPEDRQRQLIVLRAIDKLDRVGIDGVRLLLGKGRKDPTGDFTKGAELEQNQIDIMLKFVESGATDRKVVLENFRSLVQSSDAGRKGIEELVAIDALLDASGLGGDRVSFDPTIVRGLEYYTGPVFEAVLTFEVEDDGQKRSFGAVAGGGRYDDLVKRFTGKEVPATGASIGVDRLLAALKALGKVDLGQSRGPVIVTVMDKPRLSDYQTMVAELRAAGIAAELYLGDGGFRQQLKYADKRRSPAIVIAGSDEFAANEITIKDFNLGKQLSADITDRDAWLKANTAQIKVPRGELVSAIAKIATV